MEIIRNLILMGSLQLFAGALNTNVTTDSGLSAENKTFYDRTLLESANSRDWICL